jgi:Ca2+/Na+ antiporter
MAHFVVSKRRGRASENLQKPKLSKGLPPPPPPPPLSSSVASPIVPKIKKARLQKLESETLTIILLAVSTLMSLIFYGTVYFMPFFVALLIFYAAYLIQVKFTTLSKQDLNVPEAERLLVSVKDQKCFSCGSVEKNVSTRATHSSIFGEGTEIQLTCKGCGTITIWKKGKLTKKTP